MFKHSGNRKMSRSHSRDNDSDVRVSGEMRLPVRKPVLRRREESSCRRLGQNKLRFQCKASS